MQTLTAEAILELIRSWVEIESPTNAPDRVNAVLDLCAEQLSAIGGGVDRRSGTEGLGDILVVRIPGERNGPGVMVLGHVDTVHQVGALAGPLAFRREGDRVCGPGIYDMKGGNCLAVAALQHLAATGRRPKLGVTVMMVPDEEIGSPSSRAQIEAEAARCKYVLVPEPSGEGGKLTTGRYGIARYHLRTRGRPAHAGANHQDGRSAIREMAHQILAVEAMTDCDRGITLNVGNIRGGTHENVVPVDCEAKVLALVPDVAAEAEVRTRLLALRATDPNIEFEVTPGLFRPPFEMTPANRSLYERARDLAREIGFDPGWRYAGGGSDGNFTGALGIPTLDGLGVIGNGAHTLEEHLLFSSLEPRARLFERLFETLD